MLRKLGFLVSIEVALFGGAGLVEALGFSLSWVGWAFITSAGITTALGIWRSGRSTRKSKRDFGDFDMQIETAIDHIVDSTHHSFTRSSLAERNAFEQLHKAMCAGLLPVIGKHGENAIPRKISPRRCKKLQGREVATPHGMRFHLVESRLLKKNMNGLKKEPPVLVEQSGPFGFGELRVRSKDLYGIWPRNMEGGA